MASTTIKIFFIERGRVFWGIYREEVSCVDGEQRDLIDLRAEESELRVGERESLVARRQLYGRAVVIGEEGALSGKCDAESEAVGELNFGV